jgi:outer membrane protein assembly factor BamB
MDSGMEANDLLPSSKLAEGVFQMKRMFRSFSALVSGVMLSAGAIGVSTAQAEDWSKFRGPGANGLPANLNQGLPVTWSDSENVVWKTELPGIGASSPVLFKGKIYLTAHDGYGLDKDNPGDMSKLTRKLLCIDAKSGKVEWTAEQSSLSEQEKFASFTLLHGYASGTPAVDASGIYVFYGTSGAAAYDFDGKQRWITECGKGTHVFGTSNSPVIYKNVVIVNASVECGDLIGLDSATGKEVWRAKGMDASWNTPIVVSTPSGDELVVSVKGKVLAFNPANGEKLWECKGIDDYICPSVFEYDNVLFACGGRKNTIVAIKPGGRGDVTESHTLFRLAKGSNVSSPIIVNGRLYWFSESKGIAYCADAKSGEMIYEERVEPKPERFYASPVAADENIFFVSRIDGTFVVPASDKFTVSAVNKFESDSSIFNGSPIVDSGKLYLRSDKFLYCIGKAK